MFKKKVYLLLLCIFLFSTMFCYAKDYSFLDEKEKPILTLWAKADKMVYCLNEDTVNINVYLKNNSDETLELVEPAIDKRSFVIQIEQPDEEKQNLLEIYGLDLKTIRLFPGKRIKFPINFSPETLGEHKVHVLYNGFNDKTISVAPVSVFVVRQNATDEEVEE
ncbi:MAG: hypothetical protein GY853_05075 [PVC group bacterium]|nr:hypothetical protein [PVC group bacterium]